MVSDTFLTYVLALVAVVAAFAGGRRKGMRWKVDDRYGADDVGEWIGTMNGAYLLNGGVVPYATKRVRLGLLAMGVSGVVTGISGVGGGFIKTPASSEIMHAPVKVAASTTTFSIGITAAAALLVKIARGAVDFELAAMVMIGALVGGQVGSRVQARLSPPTVRKFLSVLLVVIAFILVVRA